MAKILPTQKYPLWFDLKSCFGRENVRFSDGLAIIAKFLLKINGQNQTIRCNFAPDLKNASNKSLLESIYNKNVNRLIGLDGI